jgi:hypothetical protein
MSIPAEPHRVAGVMDSPDIRSSNRSVHTQDVVAPAPDVVASRRRSGSSDIAGVEGFRVDGPDGRVGVVTRVSASAAGAPPDTIHVVTGLFIVRVVPIAASEIVRIDADLRRVDIRSMVRRPRSPHVARMLRRFLASVGNGAPPSRRSSG